jgi:2-polyprenyl-3-methyl-5-hydroxy-6-metoxy-1,4-benzoquinol methylase
MATFSPEYFRNERPEVTQFLPHVGPRVLDLGCGDGFASHSLRRRGAKHITGVEYVPDAAKRARDRLDVVHTGDALEILPTLPAGTFDLLLAYDVLEHLVDPWSALAHLRRLVSPDGVLHVSVPNARSLVLLRNIVARGTFGYDPRGGLCDLTHLRWFTRRDMTEALAQAGWHTASVDSSLGVWGRRANVCSLGLLRDFIVGQYYFRAVPA